MTMPRRALLRGDVRLAAALAVVALGGCAAGTAPLETCIEHSVEEGIGREQAEAACEDAVSE